MRLTLAAAALVVLLAGCSMVPDGAYYPTLSAPATVALSHSLYRAAQAAGDDPDRYSFALVKTTRVDAWATDDATFYFTDGLAGLPSRLVEPIVAHEVAHEVLGHVGTRRTLSLSITAGFAALGVVFPGVGLIDVLVNPLVVRAFSRDQELDADRKAVEILRVLGYASPRRALAEALQSAERINGPSDAPGFLATHPTLAARLDAIGPLEPPLALAARTDILLAR